MSSIYSVEEVITQVPVFEEEITLQQLDTDQFFIVAQKAILSLNWQIVVANDTTIICHIPYSNFFDGELITISVIDKVATLRGKPLNEYYWDEAHIKSNLANLKEAILIAIKEQPRAAHRLAPVNREKYGALVLSKTYTITPLIVYANALVFIAMIFAGLSFLQPSAQSLYNWGGNLRAAVAGGQWWRLISYMFLHAGIMHIVMNMFSLLYIGMYLEPLLGKFRFASAYLLTGICAGLLSIFVHNNSVGVGASGAIFGMYGVFLSILSTRHIQKTMRKTMLRSMLFFVIFNLLYGLQGNTDNAAHIGGLISGLAIGYVYYWELKRNNSVARQIVTTGIIATCVILLTVFVLPLLNT